MKNILDIFKNNDAFKAFSNYSNELGNLNGIEEALMIAYTYKKNKQSLIIVKNNLYSAQKLYDRLYPLLKDDVLLFSMEESLRIEAIAASPESEAMRIESMHDILNKDNCVLVTHVSSLLAYLPNPYIFRAHSLDIKVGDEIGYETLKEILFESGYDKTSYVDQPLTFASRGGIIDVFSLNYDNPLRIEFFDEEIESIRFFDIASKKTIKQINNATIIPGSDILFDEEDKQSIIDYLDQKYPDNKAKDLVIERFNNNEEMHSRIFYGFFEVTYGITDYVNNAQIIMSSVEEIKNHHKNIYEENVAYIQEMSNLNELLPIYTIENDLNKYFKQAMKIKEFVDSKKPILSGIETAETFDVELNNRLAYIQKLSSEYQVYISVNEVEKDLIKQASEFDFKFVNVNLNEGFIANYEKIAFYTSKELFDSVHINKRYANKFKNAESLDTYLQLNKGDYIVHKLYGVGQFIEIETRAKEGIHKDYLKIAYKGNDILYVPLEQFKLVRKFVSKEGARVKLNKLGSNDWQKSKEKVSANVKELADRLVKLYSLREKKIGFAFSKDTNLQKSFENDFEYVLTKDQKTSLKEIKKDMESDKPMDRLLCGDVGFGKTEVALCAAYKAICDGKQVAFLCPTTILSFQHFKTSVNRFKNQAINIKVINRFISNREITQIKKELKAGKIDLLIGTHRLLSKDIIFKDLGLLIIDEEQRFGVEHKEKIKELKNSLDVLSLSATPIPRTLQMSLVGIRSLSQLNTPPSKRMSVQTYVVEKDERLIKEVIQRELARHGQVFYLYNNVSEIYNVANKLLKDIKDVKIGVAHGKMSKEEIEDVMLKFNNGEYQVLVCTTIIETGIDIPNANTILIDNADRFGLSQLYQIKGRVGRSDRLAYAYLMYAPHKQLSEIASKRLKSMKEFARLGSGYKIALRDLTIRGAGEMLGPKQAGFIDTVGMDMYIEMLNEAILASKGEVKQIQKEEKKANVQLDAYIPKKFEEEDYEKISLYQEIDDVKNRKQLDELIKITTDNYGKLPKEVNLLFKKKQLDLLINKKYVESFKERKQDVVLTFSKEYSDSVNGIKLFEIATKLSKDLQIRYTNQKIVASLIKDEAYLNIMIEFISECGKL